MAPRRVDQRLVTKAAKTASAGSILLALAVAALALAGCGGGSSDSSTSSTSTSGSGVAAGGSTEGSAHGTASAGSASGASGASAGEAGGGSGSAAGGQSSSGGKQGPRVPQPKGEPESGITPKQREEATVADMLLQSPVAIPTSEGVAALPSQYTCDGKNTSPALHWDGVPPGTAELALFAMNIQPVEERLFFDWAVAGINPGLGEIEAGSLPKGVVVGRNGFGKTGYGLCPPGAGETYMFALYALPKKLSPSQGFDPLSLRKTVLDTSGNVGLLALSYAHG